MLFSQAFKPTGKVNQTSVEDPDLNAMLQPVPLENCFIDPGHYVWCGSVTKGKDWKAWAPARHTKVIGSSFLWENVEMSISKLERPCLYIENGIPGYLYGANRADKGQTMSFNVAVPPF